MTENIFRNEDPLLTVEIDDVKVLIDHLQNELDHIRTELLEFTTEVERIFRTFKNRL